MNLLNKLVLTNLVFLALALGGCAPKNQTPPPAKEKFSATVNKSYDVTWEALIQYVSSSFFVIENFDKSSGLIILSFGASHADEYIDCGTFRESSPEIKYTGPCTSFLEQYAGAKLQGKMHVLVTELGPGKTNVRVNAKYVFASKLTQPAILTFDSGTSATVTVSTVTVSTVTVSKQHPETDSVQTKVCHPTFKAENKMMQVIKLLN